MQTLLHSAFPLTLTGLVFLLPTCQQQQAATPPPQVR